MPYLLLFPSASALQAAGRRGAPGCSIVKPQGETFWGTGSPLNAFGAQLQRRTELGSSRVTPLPGLAVGDATDASLLHAPLVNFFPKGWSALCL